MKITNRKTAIQLAVIVLFGASIASGDDCTITDAPSTPCNMYCNHDQSPKPSTCYEAKLDGPCENYQYQSGSDAELVNDYYQIPYKETEIEWNYNSATDTCSTTSYRTKRTMTGTCTTYDADDCGE